MTPSRRPPATSSIGTISGGSLAILGSPSTFFVSFASALTLSLDRALARLRSKRFSCFADASAANRPASSSTSMRAYQMSRFDMLAKSRIASR